MFRHILISTLILCSASVTWSQNSFRFDDNWKFSREVPDLGPDAPDNFDPVCVDFDDKDWRTLDLPHDWSIECDFDAKAPAGADGGYLATGKAIYRKSFRLPKGFEGKRVRLYFEGVYMNSSVFVNSEYVGGHPYGYNSFAVDITDQLKTNGENLVAVMVDNSQQKNCRWYSGSGIYRHVWLQYMDDHTICDPWKLYVRTEKIYGIDKQGIKADSAAIRISYEGREDEVRMLRDVALWSPEHPALYDLKVGELTVEWGIREITYSVQNGLKLNGQPIILNGGCLHHDNGILGAAAFDRAEWRKVELMKAGGFNAARTSHNPPSPEFLRACDHLGLLVIDEIFDGLREEKNSYDYHTLYDEWWQNDVESMVRRDRNHPSVFCWSTGNEVMERKKIEIVTTTRKIADLMHQLDPSRPVTQALASWDSDWEIYDPLAAVLDIAGYNYMIHKHAEDHQRVPGRVIMHTESYPRDAASNWKCVTENPYILGDFVWTALDYVGESGIGVWHYPGENQGEHYQGEHYPWHGAYCGDIDVTGWRKPISHYRDILYNEGDGHRIAMGVREPDGYHGAIHETSWSVWPTWESWTWPGYEGKDITVDVYSRYPKVRLYLNEQLIGEKPTGKDEAYLASFTLPYQIGTLRSVGITADGQEDIANEQILKTAGKPFGIRLTPDKKQMSADGQDLVFITIEIVDSEGNVVPEAECDITVELKGTDAKLQAIGSANMHNSHLNYTDPNSQTWKGRCLAIVRAGHKRGNVNVTVYGETLKGASVKIQTK